MQLTTLMPQPGSIDYGDGWLHVKGGFQVEWLGYRDSVLDRSVAVSERGRTTDRS